MARRRQGYKLLIVRRFLERWLRFIQEKLSSPLLFSWGERENGSNPDF